MDSVKKILNNGVFIATLAPLLDGPEASDLAKAARAFADITAGLGIKASAEELKGFKGCVQGQLLTKWIFNGERADLKLMEKWTADIVAAITDLANGKLS